MSALALPPTSTVRAELRAWVAAARGALAWHVESGELDLPVADDFALPPLGLIEPVPRKASNSQTISEDRGATSPQRVAPEVDDSAGPSGFTPPPSQAAPVGPGSAPIAQAAAPVALRQAEPIARPQNARGVAALALDTTEVDLGACTRCGLCKHRKELVFGAGAPDARVMFVGDVPGPAEDALGAAFADEAGALLGKMVRAMGLSRQSVYLTYLLKCHPGPVTPGAESWAACQPFFDRQLDAIRPQVIVALGENAGRTLCASEASMPRLRGRWGSYRGIDVLPTFHPAALMQNPQDRNLRAWVWDDLKKVMRHLGLAPPEG